MEDWDDTESNASVEVEAGEDGGVGVGGVGA